ncbi:hypothetical protein WDW37_17975 [Bdellovibrionota bacterium FG-1]
MSDRWPRSFLFFGLWGGFCNGLLCGSLASAEESGGLSSFRLGVLMGYGVSAVSISPKVLNEGPLLLAASLEWSADTTKTLALEHLRTASLSPIISGVGVTSLIGRWYFWNGTPGVLPGGEEIFRTAWYRQAWSPYLGLGVDFSQGTLSRATTVGSTTTTTRLNSSGVGILGKLGLDYTILRRFGMRMETGLGTTLNREVTFFHASLGFYWFLP